MILYTYILKHLQKSRSYNEIRATVYYQFDHGNITRAKMVIILYHKEPEGKKK
jgi:hypothetical protein